MPTKLPIAVIVIPTYNEANSIGEMIDYLFNKTFPGITDWDCQLLVVDDTSPDGTYKVVQEKQKKYKKLHLFLNKQKAGIGTAYVVGFRYAMKELKADVLIEFDGDFQHPPETIPVMLKEIKDGADYVLGSRKIKGGSNPRGWGFKRVFFSEFGGFTARIILFFPFKNFLKITDPTTGLKASRVKDFVDKIDMDHLYSYSFAYKMDFLFQMIKLGAKTKEIPLQFGLRESGASKIEPQTAKDVLKTVILLRWHDDFTRKFLKFGIVGGFGFIINIVGFRVFKVVFKGLPIDISWINFFSNALASEMAIISNFTWNNLWTFRKEKISGFGQLLSKLATFNLSSFITGIIIPSSFIAVCTYFFSDKFSTIYLIIGVFGLTIPLNWFVYNTLIWKKKII
jgi:dolichol-phosphate mannosyltransferase